MTRSLFTKRATCHPERSEGSRPMRWKAHACQPPRFWRRDPSVASLPQDDAGLHSSFASGGRRPEASSAGRRRSVGGSRGADKRTATNMRFASLGSEGHDYTPGAFSIQHSAFDVPHSESRLPNSIPRRQTAVDTALTPWCESPRMRSRSEVFACAGAFSYTRQVVLGLNNQKEWHNAAQTPSAAVRQAWCLVRNTVRK